MIYTVHKHLHFSLPRFTAIRRKPEEVIYACRCLPSFEHKFDDWEERGSDQWDWSKLWGFSFHWWTNHKNTAMVGVRYNPRTERVELVPYYHINGSKGIYPPTPLAKVKLDETFYTKFTIDYKSKTYQLTIQTPTKIVHSIPMKFEHNRRWTRGINFYFGGNRTAPKKVQVSLLPIKSMPPLQSMRKTIGHETIKTVQKSR